MINPSHSTHIFSKIAWALAPLAWGAFVYFMAFGPGALLIPHSTITYQINFLTRVLFAYSIIIPIFGPAFSYAYKHYQITIFGYLIPLPPWWIYLVAVVAGIGIGFFFQPLWTYDKLNSFILGTLISSCIEELVTRSFFVKYMMNIREFLLFNTISSIAFSLMHAGYNAQPSIAEFLSLGHFIFSFLLGIIIYRTQRIELPITLHMLSNATYMLPAPIRTLIYPIKFLILITCAMSCKNRKK